MVGRGLSLGPPSLNWGRDDSGAVHSPRRMASIACLAGLGARGTGVHPETSDSRRTRPERPSSEGPQVRTRQQIVRATGVVVVLLGLCCACGTEDGAEMQGDEGLLLGSPTEDYAIVTPVVSEKRSVTTIVSAVRVLPDGATHVELEGSPCEALTEFNVSETTESVTVEARVVDITGDGDCTANIIPWLVELDLDAPLGVRTVIDKSTGEEVRVYHCVDYPEALFCSPEVTGVPTT